MLIYLQKEFHFYLLSFLYNCSSNLQRNFKQNRKGAITKQITLFSKFEKKRYLDIHLMKDVLMLESSRLKGVAKTERKHISTYQHYTAQNKYVCTRLFAFFDVIN